MVKALLGLVLLLAVPPAEETFTVAGTVLVAGPVKPPKPNKALGDDPPCCALHPGQLPKLENLVLDEAGGVRWSFVYVKKGLEGKEFEAPKTPVDIDQQGCLYTPHVAGAQVGQVVNFRNSDPVLHNVHGLPFTNKGFNFGQVKGAVSPVKFGFPEVPIKVKCDVHPWMATFVCVVDHPFFAVTDAAGKFQIAGLPAGTYTIGVWHEGLKFEDQVVTVKANQQLQFKAP